MKDKDRSATSLRSSLYQGQRGDVVLPVRGNNMANLFEGDQDIMYAIIVVKFYTDIAINMT